MRTDIPIPVQIEVRNNFVFANGVRLRSVEETQEVLDDHRFWIIERWQKAFVLERYTVDYLAYCLRNFLQNRRLEHECNLEALGESQEETE